MAISISIPQLTECHSSHVAGYYFVVLHDGTWPYAKQLTFIFFLSLSFPFTQVHITHISTTKMSTTLYCLLTSAILLGAENGDISNALDTAAKVFKEYLSGYILPLIAVAILQWMSLILQRRKRSKSDHMGDDRTRLVRLLARAYGLTLSTIYTVDETTVEFQSGILHAVDLIQEVRIFDFVVVSWQG